MKILVEFEINEEDKEELMEYLSEIDFGDTKISYPNITIRKDEEGKHVTRRL